jgi:hypothetical protein
VKYVEEKEFVVRLALRCEFPDDYEGEEDGYEWLADWPAISAELVQVIGAALKRRPGWQVRPGNRGRPTDEEITLVVERVVASSK